MEVVSTGDSSSSVYSSKFKALYHSRHGAYQESDHVFIQSGLAYFNDNNPGSISVLEIGFGTGLNALLTALYAQQHSTQIIYTTLEAYPLSEDVLQYLNYGELLQARDTFDKIHRAPWDQNCSLTEQFEIDKRLIKFEDFRTMDTFDVIYFDAFAPNTQPALWEEDMMKKMHTFSKNGSILVTYCAKGEFRRTLEKVGFTVERIPGPPGKREMIRATCIK